MSNDVNISKGRGFSLVALSGVGHMHAKGNDEKETAREFYVAATKATQGLVITASGGSGFGRRFQP